MKKTIIAVLALAVLLCACGKTEGEFKDGSEPNTIARFEELLPSTDIRGLSDKDGCLVPYEFNKPFKSVRFWIEMYDYGNFVNSIDVFGIIGPAVIEGELLEDVEFSGVIDNEIKSKSGFIAMYPGTWGDMIPGLEFVNYLEDNKDPRMEKAYIEYERIWPGKELEIFTSGYQPEGDDRIISGEERIISYIGFREEGEYGEVTADLIEESTGESSTEMTQIPYLLVLKCEFEF